MDRGVHPFPVNRMCILREPSGSFWMQAGYGTHVLSILDGGRRLAMHRFEVYSTLVGILYPVNLSTIEPHNVLAVRDSGTDLNIPLEVRFLTRELLPLLPTIRFQLNEVRPAADGSFVSAPGSVSDFEYTFSLRTLGNETAVKAVDSLALSFPVTLPSNAGDIFALSATLEFDTPLSWVERDRRPTYIRLRERPSYDALWDRLRPPQMSTTKTRFRTSVRWVARQKGRVMTLVRILVPLSLTSTTCSRRSICAVQEIVTGRQSQRNGRGTSTISPRARIALRRTIP